jgi:AbrB family looped-hinge helix DNA binding protein
MTNSQLPRKPIFIDSKGRVTIPSRFRSSLGIPEGEKYPLWIEEYSNEKGEVKCLILRK